MNKRKILASITTIVITGTTLLVVPQIYAQSSGSTRYLNFFQEFIQFISQKFGLDKTQVQSALTDFRNQQKANITPRPTQTPQQMADREKSRLDQLVKDGKISSDQETTIMSELAALRTKYNLGSQTNLTPDQRKTQMTDIRNEIVAWSKSQGIDSSYVMGFGTGGRGRGDGKGWNGRDGKVTPTPNP